MWRAAIALVVATFPALVLAQPALQIVTPGANSCVNNGPEVFAGGAFFGQALPSTREIPLDLSLAEPNGAPIDLVIEADGVEVFQAVFQPAAAGVPERTGDRFNLPSFFLDDGPQRSIRVTATSPAGQVVRSVQFRLDRRPPRAVADGANFPDLAMCYAQVPAVQYQVVDDQDPAPVAVERTNTVGCQLNRIVRVTDDCGNAQDVSISVPSQPPANGVQIELQGFRCGLEDCVVQGPDAERFNNNDRVGAATVVVNVINQPGCVGELRSRVFFNANPPAQLGQGDGSVLIPGQPLRLAGRYVAVVEAYACGARVARSELAFTVLDRPQADAGGPYTVVQGAPLTLDASQSVAPAEIGGIVEYAWDVDGDGLFDFAGPNEVRVPFDSSMGDDIYQGTLRVTAGNGAVAFDVFPIEVTDVDPRCSVGGPYMAMEGEPVAFDGSGSAAGHPSDPLGAFSWDFGDGLFPQVGFDLQHPSHIYEDSGRYTVRLVVSDGDSSSMPCNAVVDVQDVRPIVENIQAFRADRLVEGDEVFFSSGGARPGSGTDPITRFCWDFGEGEPECGPALRNPSHVFNDNGVHHVCLRVEDEEPNDFAEACVDIELADLEPLAALQVPAVATEGDVITLDATGSASASAADPLTRLEFTIIDEAAPNQAEVVNVNLVAEPNRFRLDHPLAQNGNLIVRLRVYDEDSFAEVERRILVADVSPIASARPVYPDAERVAREGQELLLDASNSQPGSASDPIAAYNWDFGDGTLQQTAVPTVRHAWPDAGEYPVRLVVQDEDGSQDTANFIVSVINVAPRITIDTASAELEVGIEAEFRLMVDDVDGDRPPPSIHWEMGDGTTYDNRSVVRHTFNDAGDYAVTVAVDHPGENNEAATTRFNLRVTAAAPRFSLVAPRQPIEQVIQGREGQPLNIRLQVDSASLGDGRFDGQVILAVSLAPPGATARVTDDGVPEQREFVDIEWTPTFYQAGNHTVVIQALAPRTGVQRQVVLQVSIAEAGAPLLAAVGGTASEGEVTLYRYGVENGLVTFVRFATVPVGLGATSLVHDPRNGRRVFVASPGSGVAVVGTIGQPALQRVIPTGAGTRSLVWGAGRVWALNTTQSTLAIIDPDTLKVERTVDLAIDRPFEMTWLPEGLGDLEGDRIAVVTARGELALYDPAALQAGRPGLVSRSRLGGILDRVVADPTNGWLAISDRKTRTVYRVAVEDVLANPDDPAVEGTSTDFAPLDLAVRDGVTYVATEAGVWRLESDAVTAPADRTLAVSALADLPAELLSGGGLVLGEADRVFNYTGDLQRLVGAPGSRMRRLAAFVALEQ